MKGTRHAHTAEVLRDAMLSARLRVYELMELAQGATHGSALAELEDLELTAEHQEWPEVALVAAAGQALYGVVHGEDRAEVRRTLHALVDRAEKVGAPALTALALSLRAVGAGAP